MKDPEVIDKLKEEQESLFAEAGADADDRVLDSLMRANEKLEVNNDFKEVLAALEEEINFNKSIVKPNRDLTLETLSEADK